MIRVNFPVLFVLVSVVTLSGNTQLAFADPSPAAPRTDAGYSTQELKLTLPELSPGVLEIKPSQKSFQLSALANDQGQRGGSLQLNLKKDYVAKYDELGDYGTVGLGLSPQLHLRLDAAMSPEKSVNRVDIGVGGMTAIQLRSVSGPSPSTAGQLEAGKLTGVYEYHPLVQTKAIGLKAEVLSLDGQTSFKVGKQVQMDLCGKGSAGFIFGRSEMGESKSAGIFTMDGHACAGIQLGQIARIGYDFGVRFDKNFTESGSYVATVSNSASVSKIAKTPLEVGYTNEREVRVGADGNRAKSVDSHLVTVGAAF